LGCCSMILQCLSRRCERCTSGGSVSRANARSDAASHRTCCAWAMMPPPPLPSSPPRRTVRARDGVEELDQFGSRRRLLRLGFLLAAVVVVLDQHETGEPRRSARPHRTRTSRRPRRLPHPHPGRRTAPDDVSGARDADAGSGDRDAGSLKGLSKRLATQQYPSHAPIVHAPPASRTRAGGF
jgi:hypothetical protein